jgi:hypothetical protein
MNMKIQRLILPKIKQKIQAGKLLILYGPRRVGKTYLLKVLEKELGKKEKILFLNGEKRIVQDELSSGNPEKISQYIGNIDLLIVDEAQKIPEVGSSLKLIVDSFPRLKIIASGSASFELAQKVGEPLTGRKKTVNLYPISAKEIIDTKGMPFYYDTLEQNLIFGGYPELFSLTDNVSKEEYLGELADAYLLKDILELEKVKDAKKIRDLLTLLAFQIGQEVSLTELGNSLDLSKNTVYRYLDLLEKAFVILNVRGFSRNLRKEVTKSSRYYFYDNGIRNAIINNFNSLDLRDDAGMLWENYIVMERIKKQKYSKIMSNNYFWRTYDKKEIDWVEERSGKLYGYEIKWGKKIVKAPKDWSETYKNSSFEVINKENHLKFIA